MNEADLCGRCLKKLATAKCSCDEKFCDECLPGHLKRLFKHRKIGGRIERAWKWAAGTVGYLADIKHLNQVFEQDEGAKWFGLHVHKHERTRVARLIETPRFDKLMEASAHASSDSPSRQFPSMVSFVGETGAGKSTISAYSIMKVEHLQGSH